MAWLNLDVASRCRMLDQIRNEHGASFQGLQVPIFPLVPHGVDACHAVECGSLSPLLSGGERARGDRHSLNRWRWVAALLNHGVF